MSKKITIILMVIILIALCFAIFNNLNKNKVENVSEKVVTEEKEKISNEEKIKFIDESVNKIKLNTNIESFNEVVGTNILGDKIQSYLDILEVEGVDAKVERHLNDFVRVIPAPDMDILTFYYKNGKIIMYNVESTTIGGNISYYFDDDKLINTVKDGEFTNDETETQILTKANNAYNKYIRNEE